MAESVFNHWNLGSFLYCRTVYLDSYEFRCGWICNFICLYRLSASKIRIWEQGKLPWICWILCVIVWVYASHTGGINMVIRAVPNFVVLFGAVAGSVMTMKLAIQLDKIPGISRCLSWFGKNSMKILCVHLFEILILSWDFIEVKCHVPVTRLTTIILRTIFIVVVVLCINGVQGIYKKQKKQK